jgi:hypothetical protein
MCDDNCCGCFGPQGPQGIQGLQGIPGPQGILGLQGVPGQNGSQGVPGPQGIMGSQGEIGPMGPQGLQGIQGIPGKDCDHNCDCPEIPYLNIYASVAQIVQPFNVPSVSDQVLFDQQNSNSGALDFDLSQINISGDIKFLKHGIYHLQWQLQARITPPVPSPVPSWSFGFWLNGVLVPGSIYSGFTQAPGDDACHSTGDVIIEVKSGDTIRLRNTSISQVALNPNVTGSVFPITIASINIEGLKLLP